MDDDLLAPPPPEPEPEPTVEAEIPTDPAPEVVPAPSPPVSTDPPPPVVPVVQAAPAEAEPRGDVAEDAEILKQIQQLLAKPDYDPYEDQRKFNDLTFKRQEIQARRIEAQENATVDRAYWQNWAEKNPGVPDGQAMYREELTKAVAKFGPGEGARAVATDRWEARIAARGTEQPAPTIPARTITPGGGQVLPRQNRHTPPAPKPETAADKVQRELGPLSEWTL